MYRLAAGLSVSTLLPGAGLVVRSIERLPGSAESRVADGEDHERPALLAGPLYFVVVIRYHHPRLLSGVRIEAVPDGPDYRPGMSAQPSTAQPSTGSQTTGEHLAGMPDDGLRRELVNGEIREMSPAGFDHGVIALNVAADLRRFVRAHRLGLVVAAETGFRLSRDPDTVRAPDAAFVRSDRLPPRQDRQRFLDLAPDLAVEVVSPSDRASEVVEKALSWLAAGTSLVWVVYPSQQLVAVHSAGGIVVHVDRAGVLDGASVLPGLSLPVADLFT